MTWRENQCRRILSLSLQKQLFHLTKSAVNQIAKTVQWIEICLHRSSEEGPDAIEKRHGGSRVSHVPSRKLLQVRFHPHTVWSSLARTDSDGFLAPCKHNVEKTRTTKRSFTSMQMVHTHASLPRGFCSDSQTVNAIIRSLKRKWLQNTGKNHQLN